MAQLQMSYTEIYLVRHSVHMNNIISYSEV